MACIVYLFPINFGRLFFCFIHGYHWIKLNLNEEHGFQCCPEESGLTWNRFYWIVFCSLCQVAQFASDKTPFAKRTTATLSHSEGKNNPFSSLRASASYLVITVSPRGYPLLAVAQKWPRWRPISRRKRFLWLTFSCSKNHEDFIIDPPETLSCSSNKTIKLSPDRVLMPPSYSAVLQHDHDHLHDLTNIEHQSPQTIRGYMQANI